MDLRRLLNVVYAHLTTRPDGQRLTGDHRRRLDEELNEPFEYELDDQQRRQLEYRRKAREIGADTGQQTLMDAFAMKPTVTGRPG